MIIKHERFMDVAINLRAPPIYTTGGDVIIRGHWINQAFLKSFTLGIPAKIRIKKDKKHEWYICCAPEAPCVRDVMWRRLWPK